MRLEQIIAAFTRTLVTATVREIKAAEMFAEMLRLHFWQQRMSLGVPAYSGSLMNSSPIAMNLGRWDTDSPGSKRDRSQYQPTLALASCPARTALA